MPKSPQQPTDSLVAEFIAANRRTWSHHHITQATSILNRWSAWLITQGVPTVAEATAVHCATYIDARCGALPAAEIERLGIRSVVSATAHKDYQFMMWLYRWCVADGAIDAPRGRDLGPMHGIKPPAVSAPNPSRVGYVTPEMYQAFMVGFDPRKVVDCRNAAMISLMYRSGLRGSEICRIDRNRVVLHGDAPHFQVLGKNGQWRMVPISVETAQLIGRYLRRLGPPVTDTDPLFVATFNGSAASTDPRLKPQALHDMLERRSKRLKMHVTSHMFRRAFAIEAKRSMMLADTEICSIAGWKDPRMIARYITAEAQTIACDAFHAADQSAPRPTFRKAIRRNRKAA